MATTLTIRPANSEQDIAIRTILDALHVPYEEADTEMDETEYLNSSPANAIRLKQAIEDLKQGKGIEVDLNTLLPKR
ncbi:MAG: hypothetical protein WC341_08265 [Bacteroidales bacterium]